MGNLAILSPAKSAYSETFIQAHRKLNSGKVKFYYGGIGDIKLDEEGPIQSLPKKIAYRTVGKIVKKEKYDVKVSLKQSFLKHNVDKVLIEYGTFAADLIEFLDFFQGKIVVHFHGYDASVYSVLETYKEKYQLLFKRSDNVIAVSKFMYNSLLEFGTPKEKLVLNTYGPNPKFLDVNPDYESKNLLVIGRFVPKKAPYYMIPLVQQLIEQDDKIVIKMVGDGPLLEAMENLVNYYELKDNLKILGRKSPDEIIELMKNSSGLVQHSIRAKDGDMEGTPLTILEAAAAGLPIISTLHAGIPDVVVHGETGYLVEEHEVNKMATCILDLMSSSSKAEAMGNAGRKRVKEKFTLQRHLDEIDNIFNVAV